MKKWFLLIMLYTLFYPYKVMSQEYNSLAAEIIKPALDWEKQYTEEQAILQRNKIAAQANAIQANTDYIDILRQQIKQQEILAQIHHDEVVEHQNIAARAAKQNELDTEEFKTNQALLQKKIDYENKKSDLDRELATKNFNNTYQTKAQELYAKRQELIKQREALIQQQLESEQLMRERLQEIYPYVAVLPIGVDYHYIEKSYDDEEFVIDGDEYEATGYCFDMRKGDPVLFVDSNPDLCTSAQILNLRTMRGCRVWCN